MREHTQTSQKDIDNGNGVEIGPINDETEREKEEEEDEGERKRKNKNRSRATGRRR
jgi:hypothetical protein